MIAPIREMYAEEIEDEPLLSEAARAVAAQLLPQPPKQETSAVPAWQAWLLATWLIATSLAYVAITLGFWSRL